MKILPRDLQKALNQAAHAAGVRAGMALRTEWTAQLLEAAQHDPSRDNLVAVLDRLNCG